MKKSPLRVLMLTQDFSPEVGGVSTFLSHICSQLQSNGHLIEVIAPNIQGATELDAGLTYKVHRYRRLSRLSSLPPTLTTMRRYLSGHFDVVFLGHAMSTHAMGVLLLNRLAHMRYVVLVHGLDLSYSMASQWETRISRRLLRGASLVFVNSRYTMGRVAATGYPADRIVVLNPAVDPAAYTTSTETESVVRKYGLEGKRIAMTAARLTARKGHENVLRAVAKVKGSMPDLAYVIVGGGEEESKLRKLARELGIQERVAFTGPVGASELRQLYCASDVFIMASYERKESGDYEGFGIAFLEASACGKPVIGGNSGGIPDAIIQGETGLLVDPHDVDEIASALTRLLTDEEYARKLGENGRRWVETEKNWDTVGNKLIATLQEVCSH